MQQAKILILIVLSCLIASCASGPKVSPAERKQNLSELKAQLAIEYVNVKNYRSAIKSIDEAISADSSNANIWMIKGIIHQYIKDYQTADSAFIKALSINPKSAEINNNYGWFICNDLKNPSRSLSYFDKALMDLTYSNPEVSYMNKGICLGKMNQFSQSELFLNKSLISNPSFNMPMLELSRLKYNQSKYQEAQMYFDKFNKGASQLQPQELALGYQIASKLGNVKEQQIYLNELRTKYPYAEETLKLTR